MSYSISVNGHGPVDDDLRAAFEDLVRALRAATPDEPGASGPGGSMSTGAATYVVSDVPELPADEDEDADGDSGNEGDDL